MLSQDRHDRSPLLVRGDCSELHSTSMSPCNSEDQRVKKSFDNHHKMHFPLHDHFDQHLSDRITGLEQLEKIQQPCLFATNEVVNDSQNKWIHYSCTKKISAASFVPYNCSQRGEQLQS